MDHSALAHAAFLLTAFFFFVYTLLDGFDLGIGIALPLLPQPEKALGAIIPFWDGNEVWLIMAVGFIFAAFPPLYAALLPVVYLPLLLLLVVYIGRAVSIEALYHAPAQPRRWYLLLSVSSGCIIVAGALLTAVVARSISVAENGISVDTAVAAIPFIILFAAGSAAGVVWHGSAYLRTRAIVPVIPRYVRATGIAALLCGALLIPLILHESNGRVTFAAVGGAIVVAGSLLGSLLVKRPALSFAASAAALGGWWITAAALLYRGIFAGGTAIEQISAPVSTLRVMVPLACAFIVVILLYTRFIYRVINRKSATFAS